MGRNLKKVVLKLTRLLTPAFLFITLLGWPISAIWLAVIGEWWAIGYGVALGLCSLPVLGVMLMLGSIFSVPGTALSNKGWTILAFPFVVLSQLYTYAIITVWCMGVFILFMSEVNRRSFWPLLIWSYGVAIAPWDYMAKFEGQSGMDEESSATTLCAQVAYIVVSVIMILGKSNLFQLSMVFALFMLVGMIAQTITAYASEWPKIRASNLAKKAESLRVKAGYPNGLDSYFELLRRHGLFLESAATKKHNSRGAFESRQFSSSPSHRPVTVTVRFWHDTHTLDWEATFYQRNEIEVEAVGHSPTQLTNTLERWFASPTS